MKKIKLLLPILVVLLLTNCGKKRTPLNELKGNRNDLSLNGEPFTGIVFKDTVDGEVGRTWEAEYKNGKRNGIEKEYRHGKLEVERNYKEGVVFGKTTYYHENGKVRSVDDFTEKGLNTKEYFESGVLKSDIDYEFGEGMNSPVGVGKIYSEKGKISKEYVYENGKIVERREYDESGNMKKQIMGFDGYWKTDGKTFSKALHITKNQNLYNVEQVISDNSLKVRNNMTLQNNMLYTGYGDFEYVQGNDILIDKALANHRTFYRITEKEWNAIAHPRE